MPGRLKSAIVSKFYFIHLRLGTTYTPQILHRYQTWPYLIGITRAPPNTNMAMEKQPFEDVSPIKHVDFPLSCWLSGGIHSFRFSGVQVNVNAVFFLAVKGNHVQICQMGLHPWKLRLFQ